MGTDDTSRASVEGTTGAVRPGSREPVSSEEVSDLLTERRRRYALYYLAGCDYAASVEEITEQVAVWERRTRASEIDAEVYEDVQIDIVHNHLPKLVDVGVVEHDEESDLVTLAEETGPLLEGLHDAAERERRER